MKPYFTGETGPLPLATCRLGFSRNFRLTAAARLVPYLERLGVTTIYASPLFAARSGSGHGYDLIDPTRQNPEIGTPADMEHLSRTLRSRGMGLILDIVPNHMAAHYENPWWRDLLENGEASPFSMFFDVDWNPPQRALEHRLSLPVLGDSYRKVLENQELELVYGKNGFAVRYYETLFPVDPATLAPVFREIKEALPSGSRPDAELLRNTLDLLLKRTESLPERRSDPLSRRLRSRSRRTLHLLLKRLYQSNDLFREALERVLAEYRGIRGISSSFDRMDALLSAQAYWLSHWKTVTRTLNYRRFFDVADLAGVRMEDDRVFDAFHRLVREWSRNGWIDGVRVDHVDGLRDPADYLHRLSRLLQEERPEWPPLIWVEKILARDESLPDWTVLGTTGYEFAAFLSGLFTDPEGARQLSEWYETVLAPDRSFSDIAYQQKKFVAETLMGGELRRLTLLLEWIAMEERDVRETGFRELQAGLVEVTACLEVYRTYIRDGSVPEEARARIERALDLARLRHPSRRAGLFRFFERLLTLDFPAGSSHEKRNRWTDFVLKWQQFSGAVMAKGIEDTSFYLYTPLISANEVGNDPGLPPQGPDAFHRFNRDRLERLPLSLSTTSTHDTKRSADLRARITALSGHAALWIERVEKWRVMNRDLRTRDKSDAAVPDPSLEHFLYQTLIGAWPLPGREEPDFGQRLEAYVVKALRESKRHTNWITPDLVYEEAVCRFLREILRPERPSPFLKDFLSLQRVLAQEGAAISLSQIVLKAASPGVFDLYRGDELWDLSLVDPDNRRPVDFSRRTRLLKSVIDQWTANPEYAFRRFLTHWTDGRIKLFLTWILLNLRKSHPSLFLEGDYRPFPPEWEEDHGMLGFRRSLPDRDLLVVVDRRVAGSLEEGGGLLSRKRPVGSIPLPEGESDPWTHLLTGRKIAPRQSGGREGLPLDSAMGGTVFTVLFRGPGPVSPKEGH